MTFSLIPDSTASSVYSIQSAQRFDRDNARRVVQQLERRWTRSVLTQLNEIVSLPRGWDGYRAGPVRFDTANFALQLLESTCSDSAPAPQIVPGTNGDLQIEWHLAAGDLELHVEGPLRVSAWYSNGNDEHQIALTNDFTLAAQWLRSLTEPQIAPAAAA